MELKDVVILDGVRTAIGSLGGSLSSLGPAELGTVAAATWASPTKTSRANTD